jgi:hypothetical protein
MAFTIDSLTSVVAHYDAGAITGLANNDPCSSFTDTKNGYHMTAATTLRPLYQTAGINSLPSLLFDGTDDFMQSGAITTALGRCVVISVLRSTSLKNYGNGHSIKTASGLPVSGGTSTKALSWEQYANGHRGIEGYNGGMKYLDGPASAVAATTNYVFTDRYHVGEFSMSKNGGWMNPGTSAGTIAVPTPDLSASTTYYIGFGNSTTASAAFGGNIAEMVVLNETVLNETLYIEGHLAAKYGITLPTSHPFFSGASSAGPSTGSSGIVLAAGMHGGMR